MEERNLNRSNGRRIALIAAVIAGTIMLAAGAAGLALTRPGHGEARGADAAISHNQPQTHDGAVAAQAAGTGPQLAGPATQSAGSPQSADPGNWGNPGNPNGPGGQKNTGPSSPTAVCCLPPQINPPANPTPKQPKRPSTQSIPLPFP